MPVFVIGIVEKDMPMYLTVIHKIMYECGVFKFKFATLNEPKAKREIPIAIIIRESILLYKVPTIGIIRAMAKDGNNKISPESSAERC
ncbi:hypothetical protein rsdtw13_14960 [Clostridium sp. TW13]|uniref:Uncharacterized protein n=1 Tax=Inconstantimicrobium mannanitabidum TaxID=1604901 RepID=A0ACB5RB46_9CLOT|nr:hypothetical protein rsdtw13_14960 [Clostridium sp. TW13]